MTKQSHTTSLYGIQIETDDSLLPNALKFEHPDGREDVFIVNGVDALKVIDLSDADLRDEFVPVSKCIEHVIRKVR